MKITKEIVDMLLAANFKNRRLAPSRVTAIARAMKNGWYVPNNGQTIVINKSWSRLLDGQHRLYAMRESGVYDFDIPIVEVEDGMEDKVFNSIDIVRGARTSAQVVGLTTSIPNSRNVCALLIYMLEMIHGRTSPSPTEIVEYYNKYESTIKKMKVYLVCVVGKIKPHAAFWAAVLNSIIISNNEDGVLDIVHRVLENKCERDSERLLLNLIVSSRGKSGRGNTSDEFFKTTKALLNPSLKALKMSDNEDTSVLKAKNF